jgi:hypothetical protein
LRKEDQKAPSLGDSSAYGKEYLGSFRIVGDHRFKLVNELEDFKNKLNISFSFSERTLECLCKRGHGDGEGGGRHLFILADQNFPPTIHCKEGKNCPKVIRVENGTIEELLQVFFKMLAGRSVPPGSVVLCGSSAHLADVGISAYANDFVQASRRVFGRFGGEVVFAHGIFVFLGGGGRSASNQISR